MFDGGIIKKKLNLS